MTQVIRENRKVLQWIIYIGAGLLCVAWLWPLVAAEEITRIVQSTINGIFLGGIYAIIALGIVIINKASGVFNFAQGAMMMVSGFIFFAFFTSKNISMTASVLLAVATVFMVVTTGSWGALRNPRTLAGAVAAVIVLTFLMTFQREGWAWINALAGSISGMILIGLMIERFTIRPLIGQPIFTAVMVTLALAEVLGGFTILVWGSQARPLTIFGTENAFVPGTFTRLTTPIVIDTSGILGFSLNIDQPRLFAFIVSLMAFTGFFLFFRFTNIGLAMRATSENQQLAESVGLPVRVILSITWAVSSVMAGVAGLMHVGASDANALAIDLQYVALLAFPAVLLGGLESIGGALLGGLILGLTEEWSKLLFNTDVALNFAPYAVLMVILVIRPEGLFGEQRIERI